MIRSRHIQKTSMLKINIPYLSQTLKLFSLMKLTSILMLCTTTFCCVITSEHGFAQLTLAYRKQTKKAAALHSEKEYHKAALAYEKAFKRVEQPDIWDQYNAACCWALAGNQEKAAVHLNTLIERKFRWPAQLENDPDLNCLHNHPIWNDVVDSAKLNEAAANMQLDLKLVAMFDTISEMDEQIRLQSDSIAKVFGYDSAELKACHQQMAKNDSINQTKVIHLLETRGWLGRDVLGDNGALFLFMVIQHAPYDVQEKYLPLLRDAVSRCEADAANLAMLEDRVAIQSDKKQLYGSQIGRDDMSGEFYVLPLHDPKHVDKRRVAIGLTPMSEYTAIWNIPWNVREYKRRIKQYAQPHRTDFD